MSKRKTYKVFMENGTVRNLRFLGMDLNKNKPDLLSVYHFVDLENGEIISTPRSLIFSFLEFDGLKKALKLDDKMRTGMRANKKAIIDELQNASLLKSDGPYDFSMNPNFLKNFAKRESELKRLILNMRDQLNEFDATAKSILGINGTQPPLRIHFVPKGTPGGTYALNTSLKLDAIDHKVIYIELDPKDSSFDFGMSSLFHERVHTLSDAQVRGSNLPEAASDDDAFSEALADALTAIHLRDPAIGRGESDNIVGYRHLEQLRPEANAKEAIKYLSESVYVGRLEEHKLSVFYSFPIWRIFTQLHSQKNKLNVNQEISKIFNFIKSKEGKFETYYRSYFGDKFDMMNEESHKMLHLDLFYSSLKAFASENKGTPVADAVNQALKESETNFVLNWYRINQTANMLNRGENEF